MNVTKIVTWSLILSGAAALTMGSTGCKKGPDDASGGKKYEIGFLMTLDHPYWQNMRLGASDEGEKLGANVTIENAKEDPVLQIEQISKMIAKRVVFFLMQDSGEGALDRDAEMDAVEWLPIAEAIAGLSFDNERSVAERAAARINERPGPRAAGPAGV